MVAAARVLWASRRERRGWVLIRMFREADRAAGWRFRYGRPHPQWGDGTLASAALRRRPPPEPMLNDRAYCQCLVRVFGAVAVRGT
ncbi:MAG: hypothetical protein QNJ35_15430 [Paracoccaceae bacterium]|nr:hypothetical protein [Paracoccaceae bacterium]